MLFYSSYEGCSISNEKSIIEYLLSHISYLCQTAYFLRRVCEKALRHVTSFWLLGNTVVICLDIIINMDKNENHAVFIVKRYKSK